MIELKNISLTYNRAEAGEVVALRNINLKIEQGEFVVVIGANGSGKSSLLNILAGTVLADKGIITINNEDVTGWKEYQRSKYISRIFQNPLQGTAPELSILENFRLASLRTQFKKLKIGNNKIFIDKAKQQIELLRMGLENKILQPMGTLSGGQRQALTLVMAIMDDCKVLLLDEPVAALDPKSSALVMEKASEIIAMNSLTALLVTHHMKDAMKYGGRLLMMQEGEIKRDLQGGEKKSIQVEQLVEWF